MAEKVQIQLDTNCKGVTDDWGRNHVADNRQEVVLPQYTADQLKASGVARPARKLYGGFTLPKPQ